MLATTTATATEIGQPSPTKTLARHGIIINDNHGAQLFDPEHEPYTSDNVDVGGLSASPAQAAMIGEKAYLIGASDGRMWTYDTSTNIAQLSPAIMSVLRQCRVGQM
jgi:hypothetical protein